MDHSIDFKDVKNTDAVDELANDKIVRHRKSLL